MFGHTNEPFSLSRDVTAVIIPAGEEVILHKGTNGFITQALGGSFTVYVEGNLFRVSGIDADALGKDPVPPPKIPDNATNEDIEAVIWEQLKTCYDPEIPVNIYELGLIYDIIVNNSEVKVKMTLTTPNCPVAESLPKEVKDSILEIKEVSKVDLDLVWEPPWDKSMMSEAAKLELNL